MKKIGQKEIKISDASASVAGFSGALFLLFTIFFVGCIFGAIILHEYFFVGSQLFFGDVGDVFMDFFNVNAFVEDMSPYIEQGSSYPPFVLLIAKLFNLFADYSVAARTARISYAGIVSLITFYTLFFVPAYLLLSKVMRRNGFKRAHVNLVFIAFLCSSPFLYAFFRANYIFVSLLFSIIFLVYYRDSRPFVRELSLISLAVAVGIKLYPAVFALILIRDRRWKEFFRVVLYCAVLVVVPFFFFDGGFFANVSSFLTNLSIFSTQPYKFYLDIDVYTNFYSYGVSAANLVRMLYCALSGTAVIDCPEYIGTLGMLFNIAVMFFVVCAAMMTKSRWKHVTAMVLVQTLFPDPSYEYSLLFMFIPIVMFIVDPERKKGGDVGYMLLFITILSPLQFGYIIKPFTKGLQYGFSISNLLQTLATLALGAALFVDGVRSLRAAPANERALYNEERGRGFFGTLMFWACFARNKAERAYAATVGFINGRIEAFNLRRARKAEIRAERKAEKDAARSERAARPKKKRNVFLWVMLINILFTIVLVAAGVGICGVVYGSVEAFLEEWVYSYGVSDFGQVLYFAMAKNPYIGDFTTSYAPLGFLPFRLFALICSGNEAFSTPLTFDDLISYNRAIIATPQFWGCYCFYVMACFIAIYFALRKVTGLGNKNSLFLFIALFFSNVFIFGIVRGTNVLFTFVFVALFIRFKDSENKILREISYICLAVAGVMKIYPLLFGVYLIRDKRYAACVRTALYTALLLFVPFLFVDGGFSNMELMLKNLFVFTNGEDRIFLPKNISAASLVAKALALFIGESAAEPIMDWLQLIPMLAVFVVCVVYALRAKNAFSVSVFVMCGVTLVPTISYYYLALFTLLPLIEFIKSNKTMPKYKRSYYILFFIITGFTGLTVLKNYTFITVYYLATLIFEAVSVNVELKKSKQIACGQSLGDGECKLEEKETEELNEVNEGETATEAQPEKGAVTDETGTGSLKDTLNSLKGKPFKEKVNILWHDKRVRFVFVGVLNTLVGYGSTFIMYLLFGINFRNTEAADPTHVFICTLTGQILGMINSYFFNKYFTFRSKKKSPAETVRFFIVCGVQYAVNYFGTLLTFNVLHWYKILSMLAVAVVSTLVSYFGHNWFTFGKYFYKNKKEDNNESIK